MALRSSDWDDNTAEGQMINLVTGERASRTIRHLNRRQEMSTSKHRQQGLLTQQHITFFEAFGFLIVGRHFPQEMQRIERKIESLMLTTRDGKPYDSKEREVVYNDIELNGVQTHDHR